MRPPSYMARLQQQRSRQHRLAKAIVFGSLTILTHVLLLAIGIPLWPLLMRPTELSPTRGVSLVLLQPEEKPPQEPEPPEVRGQIVDLPPPLEEKVPRHADYLAEHAREVEKETRTEAYKINPEVLAPEYSRESKLQLEDLLDLHVNDPSTGARAGADRFDPGRDGNLASISSPFSVTNREGLQKPVPASHMDQLLSGAPNNDLLDEEKGKAVNLNTNEFLFADYINRIRRLVNFYWQQNLDNLPPNTLITKSRYDTQVEVYLGGQGALSSVEVTRESGSRPIDDCVVRAFQMAGPFPHPPEQLIGPDGQVHLPDFGFTVQVGQARAAYQGVDPRAGVQFPGILKATH
ncbi:MAG: TonB C-terminal domain-containing protein [Pseudomonadota bacterium]